MFTKSDYKFFDVARSVSLTSVFSNYRIGAVIVNKRDIVAVSCNIKKSHPTQKIFNVLRPRHNRLRHHYIHAEMGALIKTKNTDQLRGAKIYVYRETMGGDTANSRPCQACMAAIAKCGISDVFYTTPDGYVYEHIDIEKIQSKTSHLPSPI